MGADVVEVEAPEGDYTRFVGPPAAQPAAPTEGMRARSHDANAGSIFPRIAHVARAAPDGFLQLGLEIVQVQLESAGYSRQSDGSIITRQLRLEGPLDFRRLGIEENTLSSRRRAQLRHGRIPASITGGHLREKWLIKGKLVVLWRQRRLACIPFLELAPWILLASRKGIEPLTPGLGST
jgi:hypothetical protein